MSGCHDNPYRIVQLSAPTRSDHRTATGRTRACRPVEMPRKCAYARHMCRGPRAHARPARARPCRPTPSRHLVVIASSVSFASSVDDVSAFVALSQRVISLQRRVDVRPQRASNEHPASRSSCLVTRAVPVLSPFYRLGTYLYLHELPWFRIMY